jgi:hypothetical protein
LEIKRKRRHFGAIEEIEVVLNTLTEHDFQNAFKKCEKCSERCIRVEGDGGQ